MIINISTNLSFTMSIDNGHYKQFGGIDDLYMIKDFQTGDIYTNTVSAKTYRVNDLAWDVSSGGNRITNVLDGNIIIGGEISGNLAPGAGENIVFKSDKQYWNAFTDLNNIGRIINRNTSATDISGITLSEPATAYLYDGMVEISGVLISGHLHINSDNSRNLVFIQGISNEIQGTEPSRYHHVEGENNVVVAGNTQYSHVEGYGNTISGDFIQCEGSGNVVYGDFSHAEGEKNRIDISGTGNFCFVEGYDCSVSGVSEFSKAEGYKSSVVNSNYSLAYGREGTIKNSYGSIVGGIKADIDGGGSNDNGGFRLITELNQGDPINNPWTGTGGAGSPDVLIPLNTLSNNNGADLEIKMEWDNNLVSKIRIENNRSESGHSEWATVQLADIKVFDQDNINQISPTSTITQSDNSAGNDAYKAIDGNLNTYNTNGVVVFGTGRWVEVTLNTPSRVSSVIITNRPLHNGINAPHGVPTRIKFIDSNNHQIETFGINEWPTVEQTFTYNPNIGGGTSTRYFKGWPLNIVFDYTITTSSLNYTVSSRKTLEEDWITRTQNIYKDADNRWNWSFSSGMGSLTLGPNDGFGWKNYGFLLMGHLDPNKETAFFLFAGTDQHKPSAAYEYDVTWSKVRVYAKVNAYNYVEGSGNQINIASGAFVAGMGNRSQSSYSTVLGEYNEASNNVIFSIGHGTGDADSQRKDALVIRTDNTQTGAGRGEGFRDISVNVGMSATDISVGWWVADTVHENPCFTVSISDDAIWIDGSKSGTVELDRYKTYKFLQDGSSNIGEPFIIVATQDNSSTVLVPHQGFTTTGTAGVNRECLLNVNELNITNSTLYYMSNNNTITGGEIKIKDNIYENGKISVAKTTDTGTLTTNVYSNGKQVDTEVNSIIHTTDISCSEDVSAVSHYTNGVLDYNSGFLFGSSERLTNADKWKTSNKVQHLGSSKSQIFSATFDGTNFMDISSTLISDLDSSSHSFAVWVKLTNTDLYSKILGSFGDTSGGFFLYHRGTNNNFGYQVSNSNYTYAVSQTVALNTWYHIVGTYNSTSGAIKLYLNGVNNSLIYNAGTGYSPAVNKYRFSFGTSSETSTWSPIWQRLHGNLYDFRYFNRVMTDAEITTLYNNPAIVGDEVLRLPLSDPSIILDGISGSYSSFTIDDIDGSANVSSTEILFSDSASDLDLYNRLVPVGITEYDISYVYNIDASLVDISGAGFQMRAKKTMLIETNQHELVVSDASVCDVINVLPIDNGGGIDLYLPVPYYGIGTKYSVQFPPAGTLVSPDTSFNYNRVIFDMNGGGFSTADAIVSKDIGFAVHFVYTSETDGLIWKSRLRAYDATD